MIKKFIYKESNLKSLDKPNDLRFELSKINEIEFVKIINVSKVTCEKLESNKMKISNSDIVIIDIKYYNNFYFGITNGSIGEFNIEINEFEKEFEDDEGDLISVNVIPKSYGTIELSPSYLEKINITDKFNILFETIKLQGDKINLKNIKTNILKIEGDIKEESKISNCQITNLKYNQFDSFKRFKFDNINNTKLAGCFTIKDSSLKSFNG